MKKLMWVVLIAALLGAGFLGTEWVKRSRAREEARLCQERMKSVLLSATAVEEVFPRSLTDVVPQVPSCPTTGIPYDEGYRRERNDTEGAWVSCSLHGFVHSRAEVRTFGTPLPTVHGVRLGMTDEAARQASGSPPDVKWTTSDYSLVRGQPTVNGIVGDSLEVGGETLLRKGDDEGALSRAVLRLREEYPRSKDSTSGLDSRSLVVGERAFTLFFETKDGRVASISVQ